MSSKFWKRKRCYNFDKSQDVRDNCFLFLFVCLFFHPAGISQTPLNETPSSKWLHRCAHAHRPSLLFLKYFPPPTHIGTSLSSWKLNHGWGHFDPYFSTSRWDLRRQEGPLGLWQLPGKKRQWFDFWEGGSRYSGGKSVALKNIPNPGQK